MDQLKSEYGIGKTSLYKVLSDRLSFLNSDSMSNYEETDGVAIKDPKPTRPEEKQSFGVPKQTGMRTRLSGKFSAAQR